jgi:tryptophan halogenase
MEPLESTSIHLVQAGLSKLLSLFPDRSFDPALEAEYNRLTTVQLEQIRDFLILHYKANARTDPFWRRCREMDVPDSLERKIALFRATGQLFRYEDELFSESSWLAVLLGQGIVPRTHARIADTVDPRQAHHMLTGMAQVMRQAAEAMPTHRQYIERHCAAAATAGAPVAATA